MKIDLGINPKYIKIAIWIVVAIVAYFVIRKIWKKIAEKINRAKIVDKLKQDIKEDELTFTGNEYVVLADRLAGALGDKSSGWRGVNQEQVYEVFGFMKTNSDILKLVDAFGTRTFDFAWTSRADDGDYDLAKIMSSRVLTDREKRKIRSILAANGVTYPF